MSSSYYDIYFINRIKNNIDMNRKAQLGFVINETLTDELDTATMIVNDVENLGDEGFEPFTTFSININGTKHYLDVNTYVSTPFDIENNTYTYELSLISQTKRLERVILPNLKIRKPISGSVLSVYDYIKYVVVPYINRQFNIELSLDITLAIYGDVECPEIEWTHPNARQVINDLLGTIKGMPCICKLENNTLMAIPLSVKGNTINPDDIDIISMENYQQMSTHANNLVMDLQNVYSKEKNRTYVGTLRSPSNVKVDTKTGTFSIPNASIDSVVSLKVYGNVTYKEMSTGFSLTTDVLMDITDYLFEEADYNGLSSSADGSDHTKLNSIYFKQGGDTIYGITEYAFKAVDLFSATSVSVINVIMIQQGTKELGELVTNVNTDVRDLVFTIEFVDVNSARATFTKSNQEVVNTTLYQQQNQSSIDMKSLSKVMQDQVDRFGNIVKIIPAICSISKIPKLMDVWIDEASGDEYILSSREVAYYYDFALFKGTFTKNYVQKNAYYGVQNRRKYTQLAQANESVVREDVHLINLNFELVNNETDSKTFTLARRVALGYAATYGNPLQIIFKSDAMTNYAVLFPTLMLGTRQAILTAQCEDNYSVGSNIKINDSTYIMNYVKYVDSEGKFTSYEAIITANITSDYTKSYAYARKLPNLTYGATSIFTESREIYKDNGETLKITFQINFVSKDDSIIIGDAVASSSVFNPNAYDVSYYRIKYSKTTKIDKNYPVLPSDATSLATMKMNYYNNLVGFDTDALFWSEVRSWAYVDEDDNIIFGMNKVGDETIKTHFFINQELK